MKRHVIITVQDDHLASAVREAEEQSSIIGCGRILRCEVSGSDETEWIVTLAATSDSSFAPTMLTTFMHDPADRFGT